MSHVGNANSFIPRWICRRGAEFVKMDISHVSGFHFVSLLFSAALKILEAVENQLRTRISFAFPDSPLLFA